MNSLRFINIMKIIHQIYIINAPIEKVWKALVDPKIIAKWSESPAEMDAKVGIKFSLWEGQIHGTNLEVISPKRLKQEWYADYETPSFVTFTIYEHEGKTTVELQHEQVPADKFKDIADGWKQFYMIPLKKFVEQSSK